TSLYKGPRLDQAIELVAQLENRAVLTGSEEVAAEGVAVRHAMSNDLERRQVDMALLIFHWHHLIAVAAAAGVAAQALLQLGAPPRHARLVDELIDRQRRQIHHAFQSKRGVDTGHTLDHRHHPAVVVYQGL